MPNQPTRTLPELAHENEVLRQQLQEAEDLITAIRTGSIDALAVQAADGPRIFTLEGADQSYRTLIEQMNEGALLLSQDNTVLYCNACMAALLGAPLQEIIGSSFRQFIPPDFLAYWGQLLTAAWSGKCKGEMPLLTRMGLFRPFSLALNALVFNHTPVLAIIVTDVSAQREISTIRARVKAQNALLERKNQELRIQTQARREVEQAAAETSRILEGIPHIAWTANPEGQVTYLNQQWFYYAGHDDQLDVSQRLQARTHPADAPAALARWQNSLLTGTVLEVECRLLSRAGHYRWMLGRALPSRNEHGNIIQWIGTYTDMHEHKLAQERIDQAQRQLQENNERLTRVNVDLDNFIYTASHDLKAPINNIEGLLHALLPELESRAAGGNQVPLLLGMMQESVDRFKRTIEHLTEVTKLQKENDQPVAVVDLATVIHEISLDLAPLLAESAGQLQVTVDECPTVSFSEKNIRSILYNLLSNALKYRSPDRVVEVNVQCRPQASEVLLMVQDNGLGIRQAFHPKLFTMFQRFHDHVEGSGIGLYMVKKMVENAGGRIEVQSAEGVGSTFSIYLKP